MSKHHTHHYHKRLKSPQTKKKALNGPVDYFVYFFMYISPLFEIPQAYDIYSQKSAHTVSLATWSLFFIASVAWLIYAIRNKLRAIMIIQIIYMVLEASVVVGILKYS
jgi:uncharacterized protein with PQ loop repeat